VSEFIDLNTMISLVNLQEHATQIQKDSSNNDILVDKLILAVTNADSYRKAYKNVENVLNEKIQ
jgi:hypothetical protein